jgi:hypothetical protein
MQNVLLTCFQGRVLTFWWGFRKGEKRGDGWDGPDGDGRGGERMAEVYLSTSSPDHSLSNSHSYHSTLLANHSKEDRKIIINRKLNPKC